MMQADVSSHSNVLNNCDPENVNEIWVDCMACGSEDAILFSYWDEELECYIYPHDESRMCGNCKKQHHVHLKEPK